VVRYPPVFKSLLTLSCRQQTSLKYTSVNAFWHIRNSSGTNTDPCGDPLSPAIQQERFLLTLSKKLLFPLTVYLLLDCTPANSVYLERLFLSTMISLKRSDRGSLLIAQLISINRNDYDNDLFVQMIK